MVVGFKNDSDSDSAGNSIGKPPAIQDAALDVIYPGFEMHVAGCASDQVLRIAMTGDPSTPPARSHLHGAGPVAEARRSSGANQRALRSVSGVFFLALQHLFESL